MCVNWGSCPNLADYVSEAGLNMSLQLDVQGFSHVDTGVFEAYHARWPAKPLVASECCSCETQRGEANDLPFNKTLVFYSEFNADCVARETNWALGLDYVAGSFVWTAFDYYGEPDSWPHISSSFGSYDLAGFPKAAVWWYRSWWLANVSAADAGRPPLPAPSSSLFVHIVESWRGAPGGTRDINVFTNAPVVRLSLNGAPVGQPLPVPPFGYARFAKVPYAPGKLLAEALDASGASVLGAHARASWGAPAGIKLTLDAPSPRTGTGGALFLDGGDAALVRATVVDAAGAPCEDSSLRVAFRVTSGPGVVWGTGNGDPANQEPNHAPSRAAYHGLVRAVVRVTQASAVAGGGDGALALLAAVNVDAGGGPASSAIKPLAGPPPLITVSASAPGLPAATLDIPTSVADADGVLAVAAANVLAADVTD